MICAGCAQSAGTPPIEVRLPAAPAYMALVPPPKVAKDARASWMRAEAALSEANGRLSASRRWYEGLRSDMQGGAR